jgi:hypothetical protein
MQPNSNYNLLVIKIDTFIRRYYLNKLLRGGLFFGAVLFTGFVLVTLGEYLGHFSVILRSILFFGYLALIAGVFFWLVLPPLLAYCKLSQTITHDEAAQIIGEHFADVKDKLLNTLQLKKLADENPQQRKLIEASIDQKINTLKPVSFPSAIRIKENVKYLKWVLAPVAVIVILAFTAPAVITDGTERLIKHSQYFAPKAPFNFIVTNSSLSAIQGQDLKLNISVTGSALPNDIYIQTGSNTFKLDKDAVSKFHYLFNNLQQNVRFKLLANNFESQPYEINVNLKPSVLRFDVKLNYPAYLHKKNVQLNNAGDLTVPAGTTVQWQVYTQNTSQMVFVINGKPSNLPLLQNSFVHNQRIVAPVTYTLRARNNNVVNGDSATYRVNVIADQPPVIFAQEKRDSLSSKAIYFNGNIQDDYGFSSLAFHYTINSHNGQKPVSITKAVKADLNLTQTNFFYFWSLKDLGTKPGDEVSYFFEVADNDGVTGPKHARTPMQTLKVPTISQVNQQLDAGAQQVKQKNRIGY